MDFDNIRPKKGNTLDFYKGKSFNFANDWKVGRHYYNDQYITDFVTFNGTLLACKISHLSSEENKPVIIFADDGITPISVQSRHWSFVVGGIPGDIDVSKFVDKAYFEQTIVDLKKEISNLNLTFKWIEV